MARTIHIHATVPQILASPAFSTHSEIQHNVATTFEGVLEILSASEHSMLHAVLMFDEIATEKWPQWNDKSNKVLGVCRKHSHKTNLKFTSEEDLEMIWEELGCGKIHLAHKVCVYVCYISSIAT